MANCKRRRIYNSIETKRRMDRLSKAVSMNHGYIKIMDLLQRGIVSCYKPSKKRLRILSRLS